jgi:hypothetical protein
VKRFANKLTGWHKGFAKANNKINTIQQSTSVGAVLGL